MTVTLQNQKSNPLHGYQLKAVVMSTSDILDGVSNDFSVLIDSGAYHSAVSSAVMEDILEKVCDSSGNKLSVEKTIDVYGVFGKSQSHAIYILPNLYVGSLHFKKVSVVSVTGANFQCLLGRSILHQCSLVLDPETNAMTFDFKENLKPCKQLIDGLPPFESVELFTESIDF